RPGLARLPGRPQADAQGREGDARRRILSQHGGRAEGAERASLPRGGAGVRGGAEAGARPRRRGGVTQAGARGEALTGANHPDRAGQFGQPARPLSELSQAANCFSDSTCAATSTIRSSGQAPLSELSRGHRATSSCNTAPRSGMLGRVEIPRATQHLAERAMTEPAQLTLSRACPVSQLRPRPVDWLWPGRLAAGKLAILDGDPGLGKSLLTLDL